MMKRFILVAIFVLSLSTVSYGASGSIANIQATNTNTSNYILVGSGTMNGTTQQASWVNASTITNPIHLEVTAETANRVNGDTALQNNDLLLQDHINNESLNRQNADSALQSSINNESTDRTNGDNSLQSNINNESLNRNNADTNLQNNIDTETNRATNAENSLNTTVTQNSSDILTNAVNISNEVNRATNSEATIQTNVDNEASTRFNNDQSLQDNINSEANTRYNNDQTLQNSINNADTNSQNRDTTLNNRINDTNNRVNKLEDTQAIVSGEIRVYDSKKVTISTFVDYTTTRQTVDRAGLKVVYKLGTSYEERKLNELQAKLERLEGIQETKEREANSVIYMTKTGMGVRGKF